jgi:cytochrome P450
MAARTDILSMLMQARYDDGEGLSTDELVDEMRTLLVAGHDTTATALVWAFHYSHNSRAILARLRAEVDAAHAPADLEKAPLLGAVCNEVLRLHPVVPVLPRKVVKPFVYRGQAMAYGDRVALCIARLHRSPEVYTEPDRFDPDRFLARKYGPFEFAPFGGGARRCVGAAFGIYQMRMVLGTLVHAADLRPLRANRAPAPTRRLAGITMGPGGPMQLDYAGPRTG